MAILLKALQYGASFHHMGLVDYVSNIRRRKKKKKKNAILKENFYKTVELFSGGSVINGA